MVLNGIGDLAEGFLRGVAGVALPDPVLRLGVTGLSRAGKTVFITALVANLLERGRLLQSPSAARIESVLLQPQPDLTLPRFAYEDHLAALTGQTPHWPESTRAVSELRLSIRHRPEGFLAALGPRTLHLDIVDYPGEWLLDLALLETTYEDWSEATLSRIAHRPEARDFLALARAEDGALPLDEPRAIALAAAFTDYLHKARAAGWSDCTPGRFLLPGDLAGSPVLTFAPLPKPALAGAKSFYTAMQTRFDAYRARVVRPFFQEHFAKIDAQVVLVDLLGALDRGPRALEDLRRTMAEILAAFRPGRRGWLDLLMGGRRVSKLLFAATKADHLHHSQHGRMTALIEALLAEARARADFAGAGTRAMALASWRATVEEEITRGGETLQAVKGRLEDGRLVAAHAGELPEDPLRILSPARQGAEGWMGADYRMMRFQPLPMTRRPGEGPAHIRLDRAVEFLIGDLL
jgi:predicted YcjX-like family ATPase